MSVVGFVKYGDWICFAGDRNVTKNYSQTMDLGREKVFQAGKFVIGAVGELWIFNVLDKIKKQIESDVSFDDLADLLEKSISEHREIKRSDSNFELMIFSADDKAVFVFDRSFSIIRIDVSDKYNFQSFFIGQGDEYAHGFSQGWNYWSKNRIKHQKNIVKSVVSEAIKCACKWMSGCDMHGNEVKVIPIQL